MMWIIVVSVVMLLMILYNKEHFWNEATRRGFKIADIRGEPNLVYKGVYPYGYLYSPDIYTTSGELIKRKGRYHIF